MTSSVRLEFMPMSMREYGQKSPAFDVVAIRPRMLPPSAISTGRAKFRMTMDSKSCMAMMGRPPTAPRRSQSRISGGGKPASPAPSFPPTRNSTRSQP